MRTGICLIAVSSLMVSFGAYADNSPYSAKLASVKAVSAVTYTQDIANQAIRKEVGIAEVCFAVGALDSSFGTLGILLSGSGSSEELDLSNKIHGEIYNQLEPLCFKASDQTTGAQYGDVKSALKALDLINQDAHQLDQLIK